MTCTRCASIIPKPHVVMPMLIEAEHQTSLSNPLLCSIEGHGIGLVIDHDRCRSAPDMVLFAATESSAASPKCWPVVHRRQAAKALLTCGVPDLKLDLAKTVSSTSGPQDPVIVSVGSLQGSAGCAPPAWRPFDSIVFVLKAAPTVVAWATKTRTHFQTSRLTLLVWGQLI